MADLPLPAPAAWRMLPMQGLRAGRLHLQQDCVAEEVPVAFEYNGISHAVMMATPADLEDFALGFSLAEGIVDSASQVHDLEVSAGEAGCTLHLRIAAGCFARLKQMRRSLAGRTGCGLCGTESLAHAVREPRAVAPVPAFSARAIAVAMDRMRASQQLGAATGATHAALWCARDGAIRLAREDVGRHNALDKLAGAMARGREDAGEGFIVVSSRASYEMVQKTAAAGVGLLAAVSGVTGLAVDMAQRCGITLAGFARAGDLSVYAHARGITFEEQQ